MGLQIEELEEIAAARSERIRELEKAFDLISSMRNEDQSKRIAIESRVMDVASRLEIPFVDRGPLEMLDAIEAFAKAESVD